MRQGIDKYIAGGADKVDWTYRTLEWLITAFAGTLVFIVFLMQVYRIPTGSMAETLRGAHFRLRCSQCGYRYDFDWRPDAYRYPADYVPRMDLLVRPGPPRCPSCGFYESEERGLDGRLYIEQAGRLVPAMGRPVCKGDQIFVLKCIYQFFEPKRWDVVVFKFPGEPKINYIKRLIGLPGETVEIIDGDIFINGQIERKSRRVQEELWMCVYDNDYQPARPEQKRFNGHSWRQPFENEDGSAWNLSADGPTVFALNADDGREHTLVYNSSLGNDFRATYAYDDPASYPRMPVCSDLQVRFFADMPRDKQRRCSVGAQISKYGVDYQGWVYNDGQMDIFRVKDGQKELLVHGGRLSESSCQFRFSVVDHEAVLEYAGGEIRYDFGRGVNDMGGLRGFEPQVRILGTGDIRLLHIGLYRDMHYIGPEDANVHRPTDGKGFVLGKDEFFVCGDNSPYSADSRMWKTEGIGNNGKTYPPGVVPWDYLVGKAFFVHLPGLWPFEYEKARIIPFLDGAPSPDGVKVIFGGSR